MDWLIAGAAFTECQCFMRTHPSKMLHDCEAMTSVYGSGVIRIKAGGGTLTISARPTNARHAPP